MEKEEAFAFGIGQPVRLKGTEDDYGIVSRRYTQGCSDGKMYDVILNRGNIEKKSVLEKNLVSMADDLAAELEQETHCDDRTNKKTETADFIAGHCLSYNKGKAIEHICKPAKTVNEEIENTKKAINSLQRDIEVTLRRKLCGY